jgi:DNA-binding CsgD family transcriptional regulator
MISRILRRTAVTAARRTEAAGAVELAAKEISITLTMKGVPNYNVQVRLAVMNIESPVSLLNTPFGIRGSGRVKRTIWSQRTVFRRTDRKYRARELLNMALNVLFCSTESPNHHRIAVLPMLSEIPTVIQAIGTNRFFDTVLEWVAQRIPFDIAEVFTFSASSGLGYLTSQERGPPLVPTRRPYPEIYRQDPLFHAFCDRLPPGLYNPERLKRQYPLTTFFDNFYCRKNFGGELEFLVPHGDGRAAVIWLCWSKHSRAAGRRNLSELEAAEPMLRACVQKHLSLHSLDLPGVHLDSDRISAPTALASHTLTSREMDVARRILQGDSAKDTAIRLCIAEGTVRIHRKNIYRKLNIGSVAELFALCAPHSSAAQAI